MCIPKTKKGSEERTGLVIFLSVPAVTLLVGLTIGIDGWGVSVALLLVAGLVWLFG